MSRLILNPALPSPSYIAPEMYKWFEGDSEDYDIEADVWSIGCIAYDLAMPDAFRESGGGSAAYQVHASSTRSVRLISVSSPSVRLSVSLSPRSRCRPSELPSAL